MKKLFSSKSKTPATESSVNSATVVPMTNDRLDGLIRQTSKTVKGEAGYWQIKICLLYTSPSPRDATLSRMPSSA